MRGFFIFFLYFTLLIYNFLIPHLVSLKKCIHLGVSSIFEQINRIIFYIFLIFLLLGCSSEQNSTIPENKKEEKQQVEAPEQKPEFTIKKIKSKVEDSEYLDGIHTRNDVSCQDCHGELREDEPVIIPADHTCLKCHGTSYEELTARLEGKEEWAEYNPHFSAHERDRCIDCHKSHQIFELTCSICHPVSAPERFK